MVYYVKSNGLLNQMHRFKTSANRGASMEKVLGSGVGITQMTRDIKLTCFDAREENWRNWSAKFLARAQIVGYKEYLEGKLDVTKDLEAFAKINAYAYGDLIINCDGLAFSIVEIVRR